MRTRYVIALVCLATSALPLLTTAYGGDSPSSPTSSQGATGSARPTIPPGYSSKTIHVKFHEGTNVDLPLEGLPPGLRSAIASHTKHFTLPKQKLDELRARGRSRSGKSLPDLNLWVELTLQSGMDAAAFLEELKRLPNVEIAEPAPLPQPLPATTPDFSGSQGYLDAAPGGIEARFSFTIQGGNGSGVNIYDVEYNWLQTHEDLSRASGVSLLVNPGDSNDPPGYAGCPAPCDSTNKEHGTAVLGEMIADNDTKGVIGISWGANIGLVPTNTSNLGYNPANAILLAVAHGSAGDVILIEQQYPVCGLSDYGPLEWLPDVFQAIQFAVAQGFVVIEAAGNGSVNLDQAACSGLFDRTVRDSGAIIVGGGHPPSSGVDRQRIGSSTFGSRVDLQGWGSGVATTGYGSFYQNPDAPTDPDFWYTAGFSGTSSASPIVAGAAANLQGIAIDQSGIPLTPLQIRTLLVQTGSPQLGNTAESIGPRPDLRQAIAQITHVAIVPFAAFRAKAEIDLRHRPHHDDFEARHRPREDEFEMTAIFTLGPNSNGIAPLTEAVTVQVGTFATTIPVGSFKLRKGRFTYEGVIDGVKLEAVLRSLILGNDYEFTVEGKGADLTGTKNLVTVGLTIGADSGSKPITAKIK
jgi:serine protease